MNLENKRVLVVGTGLSGMAASALLYKMGAKVLLLDSSETITKKEIKEKLPAGVEAEIITGIPQGKVLDDVDLSVLSPGVPTDCDLASLLREKNIPVWGEIELAYRFTKGTIAAITGTNGKTTTTALVGEILKTYFNSVYVVGNIGIPFTGIALDTEETSKIAAEISSFQLETIDLFRPHVSAILNISPDHLNRHHTMEAYIEAKAAIAKNQGVQDICILNYEDEVLKEIGKGLRCRVIWFSSKRVLTEGICLEDGQRIIISSKDAKTLVCHISELTLLGIHNYENIMAGIGIGLSMGVPLDCIKEAITKFQAVEHRIEFVAKKRGVSYYNDSKGTNPDAAIRGIKAMTTPTLLIGGGYDKDSGYEEWIRAFDGKVKKLVLLGQTREKIQKAAFSCGFKETILADSLEEAVAICEKEAKPGDSVLLSPACASWGMFKDYEERGRLFKELVHAIGEN